VSVGSRKRRNTIVLDQAATSTRRIEAAPAIARKIRRKRSTSPEVEIGRREKTAGRKGKSPKQMIEEKRDVPRKGKNEGREIARIRGKPRDSRKEKGKDKNREKRKRRRRGKRRGKKKGIGIGRGRGKNKNRRSAIMNVRK
jgi:hypothetical protein